MENELKFWLGFWAIVGAVICTLIVSVAVHNLGVQQRTLEAINGGADPLAAACAIGQSLYVCAGVKSK